MRAITFSRETGPQGGLLRQYVDLPAPEPGSGQVLVRIHYAGLNNFDLESSRGERNGAIRRALKKSAVTTGIEMAGVVEHDGERFKAGDRVVGYTNIFRGPFYHSEFVAVAESSLALVPVGLSLEGAASLVGGALTSITTLERLANLQSGQHVLITGASGSVGVTAVQLASHLGARVTGGCHSSRADFVRANGAEEVYAYDRDELFDTNSEYDVIFDAAPALSFRQALPHLAPRGTYITTMPQLDIVGFLRSLPLRKKWAYLMEYDTDAARMERLHRLLSQGVFTPVIDSIFSFSEADAAFERQMKPGKGGKILIHFD